MSLVLRNRDQLTYLSWAAPRVGLMDGWFPDQADALGVLDSDTGQIKAVIVYVQTYDGVLDMHIATDKDKRWATRNVLGGVFGYAFYRRHARRLTNVTGEHNTDCLVMNVKLGWKFTAILPQAMDDGSDGVLFTMLMDDCKWIKERDNG